MARSFNQAIIMGNLTRDPELRTTTTGQQVASFAVATNRQWQDQSGQKQEAVEFHEIVAWGKLGELAAQYLAKGRKVMVVGRLQTQSWEKDGIKRQRTEIVANDISFLDSRGEGSETSATEDKPTQTEKPAKDVVIQDLGDDEVNLDDIPF
ncbi:MAG: single-stranded DNA-binding protein [Candidatus Saccharimonadia bacterium]